MVHFTDPASQASAAAVSSAGTPTRGRPEQQRIEHADAVGDLLKKMEEDLPRCIFSEVTDALVACPKQPHILITDTLLAPAFRWHGVVHPTGAYLSKFESL